MGILKKTTTDAHGRFAVHAPFQVECDVKASALPDYMTGYEYRVNLRLGVDFRCLPSDFERAERNAKQMLLRHLYGDTLYAIQALKRALYGHDIQEAHRIIADMEKDITDID